MLYFIREIRAIRGPNWSRRPWHPPSGQRRNDHWFPLGQAKFVLFVYSVVDTPNAPRLLGQAVFSGEAFFLPTREDFFSYEKEAIEDGAGRCRQSAGKAGIHSRLTTARSSGAAAPPFHKLFFLLITNLRIFELC